MKHLLRYLTFCAFGICIARNASAGTVVTAAKDVVDTKNVMAPPDTLFPANQWGIEAFGEYDNGNLDIKGSNTPVYKITTSFGTVANPSAISQTTIIVIAAHPRFRTAAAIRNFATVTTSVGPGGIIKTVTTSKSYRHSEHIQHNAAGGGTQASYFLNRYFGLALEGDFLGGEDFLSRLSGQVIARYPFEFGATPPSADGKTVAEGPKWGLAPYVIAGGGAQWDGQCVGLADVGGGVQFRCRAHYTAFLDARWFVRDSHENFTAIRLGVGYVF